MKIYVAGGTEGAQEKKDRQDETQFPTKIDGFLSFTPPINANVLFCRFLKKISPVYDQTQGSRAVFSLLYA